MKRSAQVALLLGGLTTAGATAYAVAPVRRDCPTPTSASTAAGAAATGPTASPAGLAGPGAAGPAAAGVPVAPRPEDCKPRRRYGTWGWSSGNWGSRSSRPYWPGSSGNRDSSRVNMAPSSSRPASRSAPASTSRGGFGSTGRSAGRSSS